MSGKEIIDLTDDHEVIILDSGDENEGPSTKRARRTAPNGLEGAAKADGDSTRDAAEDTQRRKKRRSRGIKRRKETVVGSEDGEVVEIEMSEDSEQVSRAQSREWDTAGESSRPISGKAADDRTVRNLLDRLGDGDDARTPESETERKRPDSDRKRKKKKKRKRDRDEPEMETNGDPEALFFVDDTPAEVPKSARLDAPPAAPAPSNGKPTKRQRDAANHSLLLPWNVTVFEGTGDAPVELILPPPPPDSDDEDYIEYLSYDDDRRVPGVARYFEDLDGPAATKKTRILCKRCGADDHTVKNCPVLICLTCGARDEHSTRGCPISKTCYTCGMKGHLNRDCPNRHTARGNGKFQDCDRCGSTFHQTIECPTLWRMYDYVDDPERLQILEDRENVRDLDLGEGGEGYIGPDDWCYNCGGCGHLGDDCTTKPHPHDFPREPSAFSTYNITAGPFADAPQPEQRKPSRAAAYAAQAEQAWGDGYGYVMPLDVGKQAKRKEKARMERRAQEAQDDDGEDWFANRRAPPPSRSGGTPKGPRHGNNSNNGNNGGGGGRAGGGSNGKFVFGSMGGRDDARYGRDRDRDRRDRRESGGRRDERRQRHDGDDLPGPSRETDSIQIRGAARKAEHDEWGGSIRGAASRGKRGREDDGRDGGGHQQRRKERSKNDDWRERDERGSGSGSRRGPRYHGGYAR